MRTEIEYGPSPALGALKCLKQVEMYRRLIVKTCAVSKESLGKGGCAKTMSELELTTFKRKVE